MRPSCARASDGAVPASSSLVPLSSGGPLPPFFCVHPVGGSVFCYLDLARQLGPDLPIYGLQARGLVAGEEPAERVEEMAARYLETMRAVQGSGPYRLGGWSFGGLVAFEMARQLAGQGEDVSLLALFDPTVATSGRAGPEVDDLSALSLMARDLGGLAGNPLTQSADRLAGTDEERRLDLLLEDARAAGALPPDADPAQLRRLLRLYGAHMRAAAGYHLSSSQCGIELFLSESSGPLHQMAWEAVAGPGLLVHRVGGDHYGILRAPHVERLARILRGRLTETRPC